MILNLCIDDWANFTFEWVKALKSVGVPATGYKKNPHPFRYAEQLPLITDEEVLSVYSEKADAVIIHHSDYELLPLIRNKRIYVVHTGTKYRQNKQMINDKFNPVVVRSFLALPEFWNTGCKDQVYIVGPVDCNAPEREAKWPKPKRPYKFMHLPSNRERKGSDQIEEMMRQAGLPLITSSEIIPYAQHLPRIQDCDIYIELFKPMQGEQVYGSFGMTALDAAALGKIVVTQNMFPDVYSQHYGDCPLILTPTKESFINMVQWLNTLTPGQIDERQSWTFDWVHANHDLQPTGEYIMENL